jgi:hypothetical protein
MIRLRRKKREQNENGFVTVEFVAGVGFLILPTMLLVTVFPTWWERVSMARVASREAARTYVLTQNQEQAADVVKTIEGNYKMPNRTMNVTFTGNPKARGTKVEAVVTTQIPIVNLPLLGFNKNVITLTERHAEPVDQYRSLS